MYSRSDAIQGIDRVSILQDTLERLPSDDHIRAAAIQKPSPNRRRHTVAAFGQSVVPLKQKLRHGWNLPLIGEWWMILKGSVGFEGYSRPRTDRIPNPSVSDYGQVDKVVVALLNMTL